MEFDERLTTLLCKKFVVSKTREVKTGLSNSEYIWQNPLRKVVPQKDCFSSDKVDALKFLFSRLYKKELEYFYCIFRARKLAEDHQAS
jgi:hypothetical protein